MTLSGLYDGILEQAALSSLFESQPVSELNNPENQQQSWGKQSRICHATHAPTNLPELHKCNSRNLNNSWQVVHEINNANGNGDNIDENDEGDVDGDLDDADDKDYHSYDDNDVYRKRVCFPL